MANNNAETKPPNLNVEFAKLFWTARAEQNMFKGKAISTGPAQQSAMAFAKKHKWKWAEDLIEASKIDRLGEFDKALEIFKSCELSVPKEHHPLLYFLRGAAYHNKGELDESIKAYKMAINDKENNSPGYAWNNLGLVLQSKGDFDGSIKAHHKALEDPNHHNLGHAWNSLGAALHTKGDWDGAIKAYRKALEDSNYIPIGRIWNNLCVVLRIKGDFDEAIKAGRNATQDNHYDKLGSAWNNLGVALEAKGNLTEAISAYIKASEDLKFEFRARALANLAQAYVAAHKPELAEEAFRKALAIPDTGGSDHARAKLGLQVLKSNIASRGLSPDDRALAGKAEAGTEMEEVESGIIAAIKAAGDTQYDKYVGKPDSKRDNVLSILRGWSSAVTLLEGSERQWRGGGYFLKWMGYGIVVDPGFDFLRNFHDAGYHGREIRAVVVSHNHPDHNSDLKDIDDLRYELYKRLAASKERGSEPYVLLWDQDTSVATKFTIETPQHLHEPVVLPCGFPQSVNLSEHSARLPIRFTPFKVNHGSDVPHAMGMVIELLDNNGKSVVRIGYTGDTAYFADLHKHLSGCDILIAHISQPSTEELQDASKMKEVHLGYRGAARLLKECKPKLALIGEFWAGYTDLRIALVKGLRQRSGIISVLPAGLAMHLKLPSLEIECTECGKPTAFAEIKVAPPTDNFGSLAYLCPKCLLH